MSLEKLPTDPKVYSKEKRDQLRQKIDEIKNSEDGFKLSSDILKTITETQTLEKEMKGVLTNKYDSMNYHLLESTNTSPKTQEAIKIIKEKLLPYAKGKVLNGTKDQNIELDCNDAACNLKIILLCLEKLGFAKKGSDIIDNENLVGLMRFQKRTGIVPDGLIGPKTLIAIVNEMEKRKLLPTSPDTPSVDSTKINPTTIPSISLEKPTADSDTLKKINDTLKLTNNGRGRKSFENQKEVEELRKKLETKITLKDLGIQVVDSTKLNTGTGKPLKEWKIAGTQLKDGQISYWMDKVDGVYKSANEKSLSREIPIKTLNNSNFIGLKFDRGVLDSKEFTFNAEELAKIFDKDLNLNQEEYKKLLQQKLIAEITPKSP